MTTTVKLPIEGGCQCGALRYQLTAGPLMIYCCNCTNCQRITGSAFVVSATITEASFEFTKGTPKKVEWQSDSGNARYGTFCSDCGCRIAHGQDPTNGILSLRSGTFDDTSWVVSAGHTWTCSAQPWVTFADDDILCDEQPEDYKPYIQKFQSAVKFE